MKKTLCPAFLLFLTAIAAPSAAGQAQPASQPPKPTATAATVSMPHKVAVVVLDPAHGGSDSGARGTGTIESEIVLDFSRAIRIALEAKGFRPVLTREGNQSPTFDDRSVLINGMSDAIFVSLHVSSTGPAGTARVYFSSMPAEAPTAAASAGQAPAPARKPSALLDWDHAQQPYLELSQRLAELVQIQLAQRFQGSPETPATAPIRQLRTVAAPAIAIEVSSIASDAAKLAQMGQPLGEALARAVAAFQQSLGENAAPPAAATPAAGPSR